MVSDEDLWQDDTERSSILVVDDVTDNIDVVVGILRDSYKIRAATNGKRALEIATSDKPPDLILLDIMMPEMDGMEVCRRLKVAPETHDIPVIFLTAKDQTDDIVSGLKIGAVDYVTKPVNPDVLKARVQTHIRLKKAQEKLKKEMELILENTELREDVERITRHDLKNPLGIILGYAGLLVEDDSLSEQNAEAARTMEESAYNMLDMINRSLDLYKMEQGSYQLDPRPVDMDKVINKTMAEVNRLAGLLDVQLVYRNPNSDIFALGDELLCHSMLGNLIKNAVEASPPNGVVTIETSNNAELCVAIQNPGVVPEDIRATFFEKYVTAGKKQGTGLGTYSAKLMAEIQKGNIGFESTEARGTTVTVCLPTPEHGAAQEPMD